MSEFNERLIQGKERIAEAGKNRPKAIAPAGNRLPPGQHQVRHWPVLDLGVQPDVPPGKWTLTLDGLVEKPVTLTWQDFLALPQIERVLDFHCVTTWSRFDLRLKGVEFKTVCALVKPKPGAKFVLFSSYDGYTTNLSLATAFDDLLLAHEWDGKPLPLEHGGPVRGVVSKVYAWKGAKWLKQLTFLAEDQPGFWEQRGYSNTADPWTNDRYG
jgi:DMSO/TMAO reductase YedYZ molybdopterin-dependent catalytic subunit